MQANIRVALFFGWALSVNLVGATPPDPVETNSPRTLSNGLYEPPREELDDAPAANTILERRTSSTAAVVDYGGYVSVQVNVDAFGNNIVGDAANEPTLAIDPTNPKRMAIGWRQFDTVLSNFRQAGVAYSTDGGRSWTFPGVINPGVFRSDPVLAADAFGNFFYSSLTQTPAGYTVDVFRSNNAGASWSAGVSAFGGDKQWLIADQRSAGPGAGNLYQYWNVQFTCCGDTDFTRSINQGLSYQSPLTLPEPRMRWGTLDTDADGVLYMVGAASSQFGHLFVRSIDAYNPAVTPTFETPVVVNLGGESGGFGGFQGPNPDGLLGQVWVAAHPTKPGHVYLLASVNPYGDPCDVMFVRSVDGGRTWSQPVRVNDDPWGNNQFQWFGTMAVAPNGRIDAVWNDTRYPGIPNQSAVYYSYSMDEGQTWSPSEQIGPVFDSHAGFPQQNKMGDYFHMISDNGGANLAYAATYFGEQNVYFIRIPMDCNENGIDDDCDTICGPAGTRCDVAGCGQSDDCNEDAIPDECEPVEDCNFNKQRDLCDLLDNPSLDCNANRRLDYCENAADCNFNAIFDICDLFEHGDCNGNGIPDDCDAAQPGADRNQDRIPDICQGACCDCFGCTESDAPLCLLRNANFSGYGVLCTDQTACSPAPPAHDDCPQAFEILSIPGIAMPFDNRCATTDGPETLLCPTNQPMGADLWYTYRAPCDGVLRVDTCQDSFYDGMLAVYDGGSNCGCPLTNAGLLVCGDDTCGPGGGPAFVDLPVTAGRCYVVRLGGWDGSLGHGTLIVVYLTTCNPTDLNGDNDTDFLDFARFQNCFGSEDPACSIADINHDGQVDLSDYAALLSALWS